MTRTKLQMLKEYFPDAVGPACDMARKYNLPVSDLLEFRVGPRPSVSLRWDIIDRAYRIVATHPDSDVVRQMNNELIQWTPNPVADLSTGMRYALAGSIAGVPVFRIEAMHEGFRVRLPPYYDEAFPMGVVGVFTELSDAKRACEEYARMRRRTKDADEEEQQ